MTTDSPAPTPVPEQTEREVLAEVLLASWRAQGGLSPSFATDQQDALDDADAILAAGFTRHPRPATVSDSIPDEAVEAAAKAIAVTRFGGNEPALGTDHRLARAALFAAIPHLTAQPSPVKEDGVWTCGHCGHASAAHGMPGHPSFQCVHEPVWKPAQSSPRPERTTATERTTS